MLFTSCDTFDSNKHLIANYYLRHDKFGKSVCYKVNDDGYVELIKGAFGRIGYDNNYIIVEESQYEYQIVKVYKNMNYSPEKGILGPFNLKKFNEEKLKLNIKADFTIDTN